LESKSAALVAAVFVDFFLKTNVIFCTKTSVIRRGQFFIGVFFWGSRHHFPLEVGAYGVATWLQPPYSPWRWPKLLAAYRFDANMVRLCLK